MFEKATRRKYRFESTKGFLNTEDLWDLPLTSPQTTSLDDIAKALNRQLKELATESFVELKIDNDDCLETKFEIVKHIIKVRLEEIEATKLAIQTRQSNDEIRTLIHNKKNAARAELSVEELEKMIKP